MEKQVCCWGDSISPRMREYHDNVWGKPCHDDTRIFKMLCMEGFQAGLSWEIVLNKEEIFDLAFDGFDVTTVASFSPEKVDDILLIPKMIRCRRKVEAVIHNARLYLDVQKEFGSFDAYIWGFTNRKVVDDHLKNAADMPAKTELSEIVSKDMKKRGFKFVGPVIIYSFLQAIGIVNDHLEGCSYR